MPAKAIVTLGDITIAANDPVVWKFQSGAAPYVTTFTVHNSLWPLLEKRMGEPMDLVVTDSRNQINIIRDLYILHKTPSSSPNRTSFVVADKRWKWSYKLIARDYNVPKRSGDIATSNTGGPVEQQVTIDQYSFKGYSLQNGDTKWTPQEAIEDILELLEPDEPDGKKKGHKIESFPIKDDGEYSIQNVILRDQGDVVLSKLLGYVPGANVYIDQDGVAVVYNGADYKGLEKYYNELPPSTWDGQDAAFIDRSKIRPSEVRVHYQREVESVYNFEDDYTGQTSAQFADFRNSPFVENVIPTVDPETVIENLYDPETGKRETRTVSMGTYVPVDKWLEAMDKTKPAGSWPWTFETISLHWIKGDLEGALGGATVRNVIDSSEKSSAANRVAALRQHFRQTFRISRRHMDRVRDIQPIRVALLDPVTGQRAPSAVWGQATIIPTRKGTILAGRKQEAIGGVYINVNDVPDANLQAAGLKNLRTTTPSPARMVILDRDQGIFRLQWLSSPFGTVSSILPMNVANNAGDLKTPTRNLAKQDENDQPIGPGMKREGATNSFFIAEKMRFHAMATIMPGAPNNKRQFHVETVKADEIAKLFKETYRIQDGKGPALEVFIPPGEITARFEWETDLEADKTVRTLLGLYSDDPNDAGLPDADDPDTQGVDESKMNGFKLANKQNELREHAKSVAAEMLSSFADNLQGNVSTVMPKRQKGLRLKGNMSGATLRVGSFPSAKVTAVHEFPGQAKPISRLALMPQAVRYQVLGIVVNPKGA